MRITLLVWVAEQFFQTCSQILLSNFVMNVFQLFKNIVSNLLILLAARSLDGEPAVKLRVRPFASKGVFPLESSEHGGDLEWRALERNPSNDLRSSGSRIGTDIFYDLMCKSVVGL